MNLFDKAEQMMERMEFHTQALQSEPLPAVCEEMRRTSDSTDRKSRLREMVGRYLDPDLDPSTAVTLAWFEAFGVTPGAITIATTPAFGKVIACLETAAPHWAAWSPTSGCGEDIMKVLEAAAAFIELIENDAGSKGELAETAMRQCSILADG